MTGGWKPRTSTPADRRNRHSLREVPTDPNQSYSTRTATPSRARAASASAKRHPSSSLRMM